MSFLATGHIPDRKKNTQKTCDA